MGIVRADYNADASVSLEIMRDTLLCTVGNPVFGLSYCKTRGCVTELRWGGYGNVEIVV